MHLYHQRYGSGDSLIILHGLFGSLVNWSTLSKKLSEHYEVIAVDQRNHGNSPHSETMDYGSMAEDLRVLMQAEHIDAAHIIGHSMGGKTAMQFALTFPNQVDKLVVVDIAPKSYDRHHDEILDALCSLDLGAATSRGDLDRALARHIPEAGVRQFLLMNVARDDAGGFRWKIDLDAIARNYDRLVEWSDSGRTFPGPTCFVRGEGSDYIQPEDEAVIRSLFPQAEIVTVADVGHWVHAEAPQEFYRIVRDFLDR